jgi:hypothetical protein
MLADKNKSLKLKSTMKKLLLAAAMGCVAVQTFGGCLQFYMANCGSSTVTGNCGGYFGVDRTCPGTSFSSYIKCTGLPCYGNSGGFDTSQPHQSVCTFSCTIDCWGSPKPLSNTVTIFDYAPAGNYCTGGPCLP